MPKFRRSDLPSNITTVGKLFCTTCNTVVKYGLKLSPEKHSSTATHAQEWLGKFLFNNNGHVFLLNEEKCLPRKGYVHILGTKSSSVSVLAWFRLDYDKDFTRSPIECVVFTDRTSGFGNLVQEELSQTTKLSINWSILIPNLSIFPQLITFLIPGTTAEMCAHCVVARSVLKTGSGASSSRVNSE